MTMGDGIATPNKNREGQTRADFRGKMGKEVLPSLKWPRLLAGRVLLMASGRRGTDRVCLAGCRAGARKGLRFSREPRKRVGVLGIGSFPSMGARIASPPISRVC